MPRMNAALVFPNAAEFSNMVTLGATFATSNRLVMLRESIDSADSAVIAMGMFCNFSDRNSAVTTISSRESLLAADWSAASAGRAATDATPATASAAQRLPCADAHDFVILRLNEELIFFPLCCCITANDRKDPERPESSPTPVCRFPTGI